MSPTQMLHRFPNHRPNDRLNWMTVLIAATALFGLGMIAAPARASGADAKPSNDPTSAIFRTVLSEVSRGSQAQGRIPNRKSLARLFRKEQSVAVVGRDGTCQVGHDAAEGKAASAGARRPVHGRLDRRNGRRRRMPHELPPRGRVVLRRLTGPNTPTPCATCSAWKSIWRTCCRKILRRSGFDNSAEALHISSYLMENYLEAADRVLNEAIANKSCGRGRSTEAFDIKKKVRQTDRQRLSLHRRRRGDLQLLGVGQYPRHAVEFPQSMSAASIDFAFPATAIKPASRSTFM